jgi:hypothetical protein
VIAVDGKYFRVLPNPKNRYLINRETHPQYNSDGSLTLYFSAEKPANASCSELVACRVDDRLGTVTDMIKKQRVVFNKLAEVVLVDRAHDFTTSHRQGHDLSIFV